jgi:dTDP-4-amino-4,6-dideoxygalactose transaminase
MPDIEYSELKKTLYSEKLSFGVNGEKFENLLKKFIGCSNLLTINNYNIALQIVLEVIGLKHGDEIIASPVSCLASNQPFAVKGLKIIWADINPKTGTICPDDVESKITSKTKAIFHNHFCGYLGDIESINSIGKKYGITVIDDGIEAFGSEYKGNKLGNVGSDITVFSFQTIRLPNTIDGGSIVFRNEKLFEKAKLIRDYGINRKLFRDNLGEINPNCDIVLPGFGGMMSDFNSFIGAKQIDNINDLIQKQRFNADFWDKIIRNKKGLEVLSLSKNVNPNYWVYGLLSENKVETIKYFRDKGFYATSVHVNNNIYSVFQNKQELRGVNLFVSKFIALPSGWWIKNINEEYK